MGSRTGFYLWQENEAGMNPGLPGEDELQPRWTGWWGHCLLHKDLLSFYRDPSHFIQALASSKTINLWYWKAQNLDVTKKQCWKNFEKSLQCLGLSAWFIIFVSLSLPQTGVSGFDIGSFAVRLWNTTPDLASLSPVKTRASCYSSSDYIISKGSTINHYPLLEKFNAYTQTEACNQSFTVTGTGGFQRVNRGEPKDTVVSKLRLCLENPAWVFMLGLSGRERGQS